jgi:hypothetical protein
MMHKNQLLQYVVVTKVSQHEVPTSNRKTGNQHNACSVHAVHAVRQQRFNIILPAGTAIAITA